MSQSKILKIKLFGDSEFFLAEIIESEVDSQRCCVKKVLLKISQENTSARPYFLQT